jgi:DNA polymerase-3 subunit delta
MLEGPDADTRILLVCKPDGQSIIPKEYAGRCTLSKTSSPPPWSKERDAIILGEAKKRGVGVSGAALAMMKELFEDIGELASEAGTVAGVCALRGAREISAEDVEELCLSDGNRNLLKLLDGLCAADYSGSLASLEELSARSELMPLLAALHNRFRLAMYLAVFQKEKAGVMNALGAKDYAARNAEAAARNYGAERLKNFVTGIIRITSNERTGQGASWRDLSLLVIDLLSVTA